MIEKILRHCGRRQELPKRSSPALDGLTKDPDEVVEIEYVDIEKFWVSLEILSVGVLFLLWTTPAGGERIDPA